MVYEVSPMNKLRRQFLAFQDITDPEDSLVYPQTGNINNQYEQQQHFGNL